MTVAMNMSMQFDFVVEPEFDFDAFVVEPDEIALSKSLFFIQRT